MANPQKENGYTPIANEIMDALCRMRIPGEERQILDVILRRTYGWNKCEDAISLSQFAEMTGLAKPNIIRAINNLLSKMIIIVIKNDNKHVKIYKINKDYTQWKPLSKTITLSKTIKKVIKSDNFSLSKTITTKDNIKTNKTTPPISPPKGDPRVEVKIPDWIPKEPWEAFVQMRKEMKKPLTGRAITLAINKLEEYRNRGHDPGKVLDQSILNRWQGLYELKEKGGKNETYRSNPRDTRLQPQTDAEIARAIAEWEAAKASANGNSGRVPGNDTPTVYGR